MYLKISTQTGDKPSAYELQEKGRQFIAADTFPALAELLNIKEETLRAKMYNRKYTQFFVPKPNGEKRLIENPEDWLKSLQGQLNKHFQAAYYMVRPPCAYGALLAVADEVKPRNIYTNALRHIGQKWLLNVDIRRFFPSISYEKVYMTLRRPPFSFNPNAAKCLSMLTTFEQRLPTGAPTSPILSNIICLPLDSMLLQLSKKHGWAYTRFIDDLSFSGENKFKKKHLRAIQGILLSQGFLINEKKLKINRVRDKPEVTGLILKKKKPDISPSVLKRLKKYIHLYHIMTEQDMLNRQLFPAELIQRYRSFINGQLAFIKFIRGEGDKDYLRLFKRFQPRGY